MPVLDREGLPKAPSGVPGLDAVLFGGFPRDRTMLVFGGPGTGKSVLTLQFLVNGATYFSEPGLLVSFEEAPEDIVTNAESFPWFAHAGAKRPLIIDGRMPDDVVETGRFDLGGLIAILDDHVRRLGIRRVVLDGIDALFTTNVQDVGNRREFLRILRWLAGARVTALVTLKPTHDPVGSLVPFEYAEYMASGVLRLEVSMPMRLVQRTLRLVKVRGSSFASGLHPFVISENGLDVAYTSAEKVVAMPSTLRHSTGVERLDRMLGGGLRSGTVTLISGLPGTAKSTLGGSFLKAGLDAGERALHVGFDEPASQMIVDLQSVGIDLTPYVESGGLRTITLNASAAIADEHFLSIERLVNEHEPALLVVDPISALSKSGGQDVADLMCERLVDLVKARGMTAVFTAVSSRGIGDTEDTETQVSTVSDTWIHVSFSVQNGERNRTLTVVKSRGTGHSNQMREMLLSNDGVTLDDVYVAGGAVLLGTARLEREQQDETAGRDLEQLFASEMTKLETKKAHAEARIRVAEAEVLESDSGIQALQAQAVEYEKGADLRHQARLRSRRADPVNARESGIAR